jgi:hypothetical protein
VTEAETGSPKRRAAALTGSPELIPGFLALGVFVLWTIFNGGFFPTDSYPGALFLLGLLAATAYGYRTRLPGLPLAAIVAIGLLAAFAAWNFISITWADDQGAAWDGANRVLLYLTVFVLFALPAWSARSAALLLGVYACTMAGIAAITLLGAAASADPFDYLIAERFAKPTGYYNANAALFTAAIFPAVLLASRREVPWPLRGLLLASAGVLFDFALLPQSRGWLIAAPVALVAYLVLTPERVRSLFVLAPLAVVAALTASPMLDVFDLAGAGGVEAALDEARDAMLIGAAALFVAGAAIGLVDGRLQLSEASTRLGTRAIGGLAWLGAVAGAIAAIAVVGNPVSWVEDRWEDFKSGESPGERADSGGSRLTSGVGSNRYDYWQVALDEFEDSPLTGVGSENFAEDYVRDRDSDEEPAHPHSLPLRILSQTGLIGTLMFAVFLVAALSGLARARMRAPDPLSRAVAGGVAVIFVYWFLHSSGDWFWAFPAISAPVFAWLGFSTRLDTQGDSPARLRWGRWRLPATVGAVALFALAAISLFLPWTAALDVKKAAESWGADPDAAFERLDRARDLNFLSAQPDLVAGAIATRLNEPERARLSFTRALERDPRNWYATLELAALDALEGDRASALARLDEVARLNPGEQLTARVRKGIEEGRPVSLDELDASFIERYCARQGRQATPTGCDPG